MGAEVGANDMRQLLRSICTNSPWKYAVLWKLKHGSPKILTWEDGYCASPIPSDSMGNLSDETISICTSEIISSNCATFIHDSFLGGYDIGTVLANMSQLVHPWGAGVIGKAAYSGKHIWFSTEDIFAAKMDSVLISECSEEWLCQFAAGIKTIVLAPVLPHGVLQLGSTDVVAEDHSVIAHVRSRFITYSAGGNAGSLYFKSGSLSRSSSNLKANPVDRLEESSVSSISPVKSEDSSDSVEGKERLPLSSDAVLPLLDLKNVLNVFGKELPEICDGDSGKNIVTSAIGFSKASPPFNQSMNDCQLDMEENRIFDFSSPEGESRVLAVCNGSKLGSYADFYDGAINPNPARVLLKRTQAEKNVSVASSATLNGFLSFPKDSELHKALGAPFQEQTNEYHHDPTIISQDIPEPICGNVTDDSEPSFTKGSESGYLLEAVVANNSNFMKSSMALVGEISATSHPQSSRDGSPYLSQVTSAFSDEIKKNFINSLSTTFGSTVSSFVDASKGCTLDDRKAAKTLTGSRRRARPGDNQRPRPRDRQLIQDRVKELRELVPNGSKCSIDGLLERTIKHMLYLKSVTKLADKLKHCMDHEGDDGRNFRSLETKDNSHFGTSWAFEVGGEQLLCPIIVEDLPHPGHMLIEILCDGHGLFVEIAQTLRNLDLTILKGVMETRSTNKWARFIVEGSRGFHRLDIFWPLMQLSQRRRLPISSKI